MKNFIYKRRFCLGLLVWLLALAASPVVLAGSLKLSQSIESAKMRKTMKYSIYLPDQYETSGLSYPVIYLLHGVTGNELSWVYGGEVQHIADQWTQQSGKACIIVIPDGGNYWYMNDYKGLSPYEDYFIEEFMPAIEKQYRIRTDRSSRSIAGLSMGGHGALHFSLKYPHLFSKCYAMSAGVFTDEEVMGIPAERYKKYGLHEVLGDLEGSARITDWYKQNMVLHALKSMPTKSLKRVRYFIDCGDDDFVLFGNMALMQLMREKEMTAEFRIRDGAHTWDYWKSALSMALVFISE